MHSHDFPFIMENGWYFITCLTSCMRGYEVRFHYVLGGSIVFIEYHYFLNQFQYNSRAEINDLTYDRTLHVHLAHPKGTYR